MSEYYTPKRVKGLYNPGANELFKLSRSKLELFIECPRCFYLDRRLGVSRPPGFPFTLNSAVDSLLKKEFDIHRAKNQAHPLMEKYGLKNVVPLAHEKMGEWRNTFIGIQYLHKPTNLLVFGAIDDLWQNKKGELIVVDYKSTSKAEEINELNQPWQDCYKRQMEIYQWLFRRNNFKVSDVGYFVYCNGRADKQAFDARLEFDITLIPYEGSDGWVDAAVKAVHQCLNSEKTPAPAKDCDYCRYVEEVRKV